VKLDYLFLDAGFFRMHSGSPAEPVLAAWGITTGGKPNWQGRPLTSHEVVVQTIAATRTSGGLHVEATLDSGDYPTGVAISKERIAALPLERHATHGAWNYTLRPQRASCPR
jgi:Rhodopirellula transposase DDE domain